MKKLTRAVLLALWCWASVAEAQTTTPNFGWTIPAEHQDPWYNSIVSLFNEIDATVASISAGTGGVGKTGSPPINSCAFWTGTAGSGTISGETACTWDAVNDILKIQRLQALGATVHVGTANSITGTYRLLNATNANEAVIASTTPTATRTFTLPNADSNPVQPLTCGGVTFAKGISSAGVIDCQTPAGSGGNVNNSGTPTSGQIASWTNATTIQGLTLVPVSAGGTNLNAAANDALMVGNGTTWVSTILPSCSGTTNALAYNISSNAFSCNTISGTGSTPTGTGFTHITAGAQDAAAKLVDTADVNNSQITYAKIQDVSATSRLLGRGTSGVGPAQEIILGTNLSMSANTLNATGGSGTTPTGTGFRHVTSGVEDAASKLVDTADVNNSQITYAKIQNVSAASRILGRGDSGSGAAQELTLGANLSIVGTTLNASSSGSSDTVVRLTGADLSKTEDDVLSDATGLVMAVAINTQYEFTCTLLANADNITTDFTFQFTLPSATTMLWSALGDQGVGFGAAPNVSPAASTALQFGGLVGTTLISLRGVIFSAGTAGNVQMQWAQRTTSPAGAQTSKLLRGSWCRYASLGGLP